MRRGLASAAAALGLVGLVLLAVSRTETGAAATDDLLTRLDPPALLAAGALMSLAFVAMALRWRALMPPGHRPPVTGLTAIICAGLLLNYAVPGPFGEFAAAWFAARRYGVPMAASLASGVTARVVGLATAALLAAGIRACFELPVPPGYDAVVGAAAGVSGAGGLALAAMASRPGWWKGAARTLADIAPASGPLRALAEVLHRGGGAWGRATLWAMAGHASVTAGIVVAVVGLGRAPALAGLAFTYATTTAGAVALFALPGSQLGWDTMFGALLVGTAGLPIPDAVVVAMVVRLQQVSFMVVGGVAVAWLLRAPAAGD